MTDRLFEIKPCGDPFNPHGWDIWEYCDSFKESVCTYRGDISPMHGRDNTIAYLKRNYPGCKVRVWRWDR